MATTLAVRARVVTKCFGDVVALDCVDLDVVHGQIHGLVGPNGAGKTTLLGLAVADEGSLEVVGTPVRGRWSLPTVSRVSWPGPASTPRSPPGRFEGSGGGDFQGDE